MAHELKAVGPARVLTNSTPVFAFSFFEHLVNPDRLLGGQSLKQALDSAQVSIYSVGLSQFWNGAAYQNNIAQLTLTQTVPGGGPNYKWYTYTAPAGVVRDVEDTLLISATGVTPNDDIISAQQAVVVEYDLRDMPVADAAFAAGDVVSKLSQLLSVLKLVHYNTQEVNDLNKRLVHYKNDGQTPGLSFNLKDAQGNLSAREVFKKELV
tara:strand:+ start:94 stop:720 length:627 start_codon:yes stop_codon:yes gene_type:complete